MKNNLKGKSFKCKFMEEEGVIFLRVYKDKPEEKDKPEAKNATGLKAGTSLTNGDDMKETFLEKFEETKQEGK